MWQRNPSNCQNEIFWADIESVSELISAYFMYFLLKYIHKFHNLRRFPGCIINHTLKTMSSPDKADPSPAPGPYAEPPPAYSAQPAPTNPDFPKYQSTAAYAVPPMQPNAYPAQTGAWVGPPPCGFGNSLPCYLCHNIRISDEFRSRYIWNGFSMYIIKLAFILVQTQQPGTTTIVLTTGPAMALSPRPMNLQCPHCASLMVTDVTYIPGVLTWILCFVIFFLGCAWFFFKKRKFA